METPKSLNIKTCISWMHGFHNSQSILHYVCKQSESRVFFFQKKKKLFESHVLRSLDPPMAHYTQWFSCFQVGSTGQVVPSLRTGLPFWKWLYLYVCVCRTHQYQPKTHVHNKPVIYYYWRLWKIAAITTSILYQSHQPELSIDNLFWHALRT